MRLSFVLLAIAPLRPAPQGGGRLLPSPKEDLPRAEWISTLGPIRTPFGVDLHRPKGRVRSVRWYIDSGFGGPNDPEGWELRYVEEFDDDGRCVDSQEWLMGSLESRWIAAPRCADLATAVEWSCTSVIDLFRDESGRVESRVTTHWDRAHAGSGSGDLQRFAYDSKNRPSSRSRMVLEGAVSATYWAYDDRDRVVMARHELDTSRRTEWFEYDSESHVIGWESRDDRDPTVRRSDLEYDSRGFLVRRCDSIDGQACGWIEYEHADDGRLLARRSYPGRVFETFDGIDRPLTRQILTDNLNSSWIDWHYVDDERGNWIRKVPSGIADYGEDVWRVIEYAD